MNSENIEGLNSLVGKQLNSITFVMDYLQFGFEEYRLTVITDPVIYANNQIISINDECFCNSLRKLISLLVLSVDESDQMIKIVFSNSWSIAITTSPYDYPIGYQGTEAVVLDDLTNNKWWVW